VTEIEIRLAGATVSVVVSLKLAKVAVSLLGARSFRWISPGASIVAVNMPGRVERVEGDAALPCPARRASTPSNIFGGVCFVFSRMAEESHSFFE
jgi:hypothetical protein